MTYRGDVKPNFLNRYLNKVYYKNGKKIDVLKDNGIYTGMKKKGKIVLK